MRQCAELDEYHKWRDGIWKELAAYNIPHGPGYAYFRDQRIQLHLFMNESPDRKAIEKAADEYKKELAEYSKVAMPPPDSGAVLAHQSAPEERQLYFFYRPPDGNAVRVPADFTPPFARGELPVELQARIVNSKPQDADTLLEIMWEHYEQMQAMKLARQKAEVARIASGNPILISEESIPPEYKQAVPMNLAIQLSALHNARDIVMEMWRYKQDQELQQQEMLADPMAGVAAALRQAGVPDSVARMAGLPVSDSPGADYRSLGMPNTSGLNPLAGVPGMQGLAAQGLIPNPGGNGRALTPMDARGEHRKQVNDQVTKFIEQQLNPRNASALKPGLVLPYVIVPSSVAAGNPAVENPLPFGGLPNSSNSPLTPLPPPPISTPASQANAP